MNKEALAARLLAAFLEDLEEQLRTLNTGLLALESNPRDTERLNHIFRAAHTLKGAARATGVPYVEPGCHALEDLLAEAKDGRRTLDAPAFATLFFAVDALADVGVRLKRGQSLDDAPITLLEARVRDTAAGRESPSAPASPRPPVATPSAAPSVPSSEPALDAGIRVQSDKIDMVMTASSQLVVSRSRLRSRSQQADELLEFVVRWAADWRQVGPAVRRSLQRHDMGGDFLPMIDTFEKNLRRLVHRAETVANGVASDAEQFGTMIGRLFDRVQEVRMRPFADACAPLARIVRDVSTACGKEATLVIVGGDVEADRAVLDILREALLHLVRNAVDHGIESPAERVEHGKPASGIVTVSASLRGDQLIVTVTDDGAGIDLAVVRATMASYGLTVPTADAEVLRALFIGGLSTRTGVTAISGRGVGLDAVEAAVHRVGGAVHVATNTGRGTTFTLECPLTLATIRALLVSASGQIFAIPTTYVVQLRRARPDEIKRAEGRDVLLTEDAPLPIVPLSRLLGPPFTEQPAVGAVPLVILRANEGDLALAVDQLLNEDEIVVHPIDRVGDSIAVLSGAAVLGTGEVAFVVNVAGTLPAALGMTGGQRLTADVTESESRKRVLVVDDSITTRTLEQSTVEAAGYDVITAVDGSEAWRLVQDQHVDLIVSDVEMPRMDGIALCEAVRASKKYNQIPVILVTALENPAHRMRGLEAGANAYIGKSSFDQVTLIDTIRQLIG
ncbi:MAG TPA: response regulator [Gemmatimonadaceae bacterium]|jgi:two-component system chemotaxis sensor kinase CheA|nr:response regulator [Gemmatimonadaceae bacterium]